MYVRVAGRWYRLSAVALARFEAEAARAFRLGLDGEAVLRRRVLASGVALRGEPRVRGGAVRRTLS